VRGRPRQGTKEMRRVGLGKESEREERTRAAVRGWAGAEQKAHDLALAGHVILSVLS
jgi:hypothetical protein